MPAKVTTPTTTMNGLGISEDEWIIPRQTRVTTAGSYNKWMSC